MADFGPTGRAIFERTYRRTRPDGELETWPDTVRRVVDGNLSLVDQQYIEPGERETLVHLIEEFKVMPGGRHLWMSGVPGRQFLFNCHAAGWDRQDVAEHFVFTFNQLMQGGGVGANYSNRYLNSYGPIRNPVAVHILLDPSHPDAGQMPYSKPSAASWVGIEAVQVDDSREGWLEALRLVIDAAWEGKRNVVLDMSAVRPKGAPIRTFGGTASGPGPLAEMLKKVAALLTEFEGQFLDSALAMQIDHEIASCVVAGNVRRSARMSVKHWADEDIFSFIHCKADHANHWSTNISVEIDNDFLDGLERNDERAWAVHSAVVAGMLINGEPGFWNRSLSEVGEVGEVYCPNPCGEIILNEWENCNLGHINLGEFVGDTAGMREAHRLMARFLTRATFGDIPDPRQRAVVDRNRRIGVGHFGYQAWINKSGLKYSESWQDTTARLTLRSMYDTVRESADEYAFQLRIPAPVKVTTVAPTGTIAKLPGTTEGIHPVLFKYFIRRVRFASTDPAVEMYRERGNNVVEDIYSQNTMVVEFYTKESLLDEVAEMWGQEKANELVESAAEISLRDMLGVQAMYQSQYADNAVSFTVNINPGTLSQHDAEQTLAKWLPHLKGTTMFPAQSRPMSPYEEISEAEYNMAVYYQHVAESVDEECATGACPVK